MSNFEIRQRPRSETRFFYGYIVVVAAFFIMVVGFGVFNIFGIFFKPLLTEFGWTRAVTSGAFSLSIILSGFLAITMGRLTDRFGPRIIVVFCGFFFGLGHLLMSQINTVWQIYLFYGVMVGIGMSGYWVPLTSTVARWFIKRRGMMTGVVLAGLGIGTMSIAPLANWLISTYNWRTSYIILGFLALILIILAAQFLKRDPAQVGQLPYGADRIEIEGSSFKTQGFSLQEAMRTKQFWLFCTIWLFYGFGLQTIVVHITPHAIDLGISAGIAASFLAIIGGANVGGMVILGSVSDKIGNKPTTIICLMFMSLSLAWLVIAKEVWMLYIFVVVFGFSTGGMGALMSLIAAELFGLSSLGVILGVVEFSWTIGGALGPVLAGGIFDMSGSYALAFLASAIVGIIGLILTAFLTPTKAT